MEAQNDMFPIDPMQRPDLKMRLISHLRVWREWDAKLNDDLTRSCCNLLREIELIDPATGKVLTLGQLEDDSVSLERGIAPLRILTDLNL